MCPAEQSTERGRYSFPKRRPSGKSSEVTATAAPPTTTPPAPVFAPRGSPAKAESAESAEAAEALPLQGHELNELLARALQEQQLQDERAQEQAADLSDLTHPAVVAIHTLATQAAAAPPLASTPSPFVAPSTGAPQSKSSRLVVLRWPGRMSKTPTPGSWRPRPGPGPAPASGSA